MSDNDDSLLDEFPRVENDSRSAEDLSPEESRLRRRKRRRRVILPLSILGVLFLVVALIAGTYGFIVLRALDSMPREDNAMPPAGISRPAPVTPAPDTGSPPLNIVLMGSDSRGQGDRGRSDVLILLHVSGDRESAHLISFPRDSWVNIPGHGEAKINAAYAYGGTALTVQTLEELLDVPMDHTARIDFDGFVKVIDTLGGITVNNRIASGSAGYTFPAGPVDLDGESALVYVRERYALPAGDFDRAERQRDVIMAIIDKLTSRGVLTDVGALQESLDTLAPSITVDAEFSSMEIINQVLGMRISGSSDIQSHVVPVVGTGTSADGQSIVILDEDGVSRMAEALRNDTMDEFAPQG